MNKIQSFLAALAISIISTTLYADVVIVDVTKKSQVTDNIDWFSISVTNQPAAISNLIFTVTFTKEAAPRLVNGVTLHYMNTDKEYILSAPTRIDLQEDGSALLVLSLTRQTARNCILELTFEEQIGDDGPVMIDIYNVNLFTYLQSTKK